MYVPPRPTARRRSACALQWVPRMPRKQRFKPSRKPQSTQGSVPSQQVDDRKDIQVEQREVERDAPAREQMKDVEQDRA